MNRHVTVTPFVTKGERIEPKSLHLARRGGYPPYRIVTAERPPVRT
jgi:hypothetical protein